MQHEWRVLFLDNLSVPGAGLCLYRGTCTIRARYLFLRSDGIEWPIMRCWAHHRHTLAMLQTMEANSASSPYSSVTVISW